MSLILDLIAALSSNNSFRLAWKRVRHIRNGHPPEHGALLDKLTSEKHPHSDKDFLFTVNIRRCLDCGLTYLDPGMEWRKP